MRHDVIKGRTSSSITVIVVEPNEGLSSFLLKVSWLGMRRIPVMARMMIVMAALMKGLGSHARVCVVLVFKHARMAH